MRVIGIGIPSALSARKIAGLCVAGWQDLETRLIFGVTIITSHVNSIVFESHERKVTTMRTRSE